MKLNKKIINALAKAEELRESGFGRIKALFFVTNKFQLNDEEAEVVFDKLK